MNIKLKYTNSYIPYQVQSEKTGFEILEVEPARGGGSYVFQKVRCGKNTCHCAKEGGELQGLGNLNMPEMVLSQMIYI